MRFFDRSFGQFSKREDLKGAIETSCAYIDLYVIAADYLMYLIKYFLYHLKLCSGKTTRDSSCSPLSFHFFALAGVAQGNW